MRRLLLLVLALGALACHSKSGSSSAAPGCPNNDALFRDQLWTPVLSQTCINCHTATGLAHATRFVLVRQDDPQWLQKNEDTFRRVAELDYQGTPLILLKPTGKYPGGHGGGTVIMPGSAQEQDLRLLVEWMRGQVPNCQLAGSAAPPTTIASDGIGPRILRRLTPIEYQNTVRDLLGIDNNLASTFATDVVVDGFANNADALQVSGLLADQYRSAAESLADQVVATKLDTLLPCHTTGQVSCAQGFIQSFGQRAFRRPLTSDEQSRYLTLFQGIAPQDGFDQGIKWLIAAFLQSPNFLYRSELGAKGADGNFQLTAWEVATQLSYLFIQSMPDDALFAAAADGSLLADGGVAAQAQRLAQDPRATQSMQRFFESWLYFDRLAKVPHDSTVYPALTPGIVADMTGEYTRLIADLVTNKASLGTALTANYSYMTDALATYYGVPAGTGAADAQGFKKVSLAGTPYGGLLTLGAILTVEAKPNTSSPILRGKLVRERFLCQPLPPPPQGLNTAPPVPDPSTSTRQQYAVHAQQAQCAVCHHLMDPIGFGFESFDGAGRFRTTDGPYPVDNSGQITDTVSTNGNFMGVDGLAQKLATSADVKACYTKMWTEFGTGIEGSDALAQLIDQKVTTDADLTAIRMMLTQTAHFRARHGEPGELDAPGAAPSTPDVGTPVSTDAGTIDPPDAGVVSMPAGAATGVTFTMTETSRWATGACEKGDVSNNTSAPVTWQETHQLEGTITNQWNVQIAAGAPATFTGVSFNATLPPGATADFGYCVSF